MKLTIKHLLEITGRVPIYLLGVLGGTLGVGVIYFQFDVNVLNDKTFYGRASLYIELFQMIGTGMGSWGLGLFLLLMGYTLTYIILTNTYEHVEYFYRNEYRYNKRVMFFNILIYSILCVSLTMVGLYIFK
jgi:hypothetical protein